MTTTNSHNEANKKYVYLITPLVSSNSSYTGKGLVYGA